MAVNSFVRNAVNGKIKLKDGTGTPVELELTFDLGDLSLSETGEKLNAMALYQRRGRFVSAGWGEREFPTISFSAYITDLSVASATGTLMDFLRKRAWYSANVGTLGGGQPYAVDLEWIVEGSDFGGADETMGASDCIPRVSVAEGMDGNKLSVTLTVCGALTGAWAAAEIA